ncbi:hypothetical protein DPV78_002665 [Talaromyces pinophilus]|nr:hypothetical protein DPV78_002665 [Talaromyces pinophilus]
MRGEKNEVKVAAEVGMEGGKLRTMPPDRGAQQSQQSQVNKRGFSGSVCCSFFFPCDDTVIGQTAGKNRSKEALTEFTGSLKRWILLEKEKMRSEMP